MFAISCQCGHEPSSNMEPCRWYNEKMQIPPADEEASMHGNLQSMQERSTIQLHKLAPITRVTNCTYENY
jgi:hypothetical protein